MLTGLSTGAIAGVVGGVLASVVRFSDTPARDVARARDLSSSVGSVHIQRTDTIVAVVTERAGPAARLAHDHLIVARSPSIVATVDLENPAVSHFRVDVSVDSLVVDSAALQERLAPALRRDGLLHRPFGRIGAGDRREVAEAMRGDGQLDARRHPRLAAWLVRVDGEVEPSRAWRVTAALSVRGDTAYFPMRVRYHEPERPGDVPFVEASGRLAFRDLGISPYRAFFGAVRNADSLGVHLRLPLTARR